MSEENTEEVVEPTAEDLSEPVTVGDVAPEPEAE